MIFIANNVSKRKLHWGECILLEMDRTRNEMRSLIILAVKLSVLVIF